MMHSWARAQAKQRKKQGKIIRINTKKSRVEIEGIQIKKQDGSKVNVKLHPSNLQIIELNLDDKKRIQIKEAKKQGSEQVQEKKK